MRVSSELIQCVRSTSWDFKLLHRKISNGTSYHFTSFARSLYSPECYQIAYPFESSYENFLYLFEQTRENLPYYQIETLEPRPLEIRLCPLSINLRLELTFGARVVRYSR